MLRFTAIPLNGSLGPEVPLDNIATNGSIVPHLCRWLKFAAKRLIQLCAEMVPQAGAGMPGADQTGAADLLARWHFGAGESHYSPEVSAKLVADRMRGR